MPLRILIAEAETLVGDLLAAHLRGANSDAKIKLVRTTKELEQVGHDDFDVALVELLLADGDSLPWIRTWTQMRPRGKIIVLSAHDRDFLLHAVLRCGVAGMVHKADGIEFLDMAMRTVLAGGSFFSPRVHEMRSRMSTDPKYFAKLLSRRQQSVFELMANGASLAEIANSLGIRESTAKHHRKTVMRKLDLHSQADVVSYAIERGFRDGRRGIVKSKSAPRQR